MIDTGSMKSLISNKIVDEYYQDYLGTESFQIQSAHSTSFHDRIATIPLPKTFKVGPVKHKFYVFDVNPQYDGLIGLDLLQPLEAAVDFKNKILKTKHAEIPLHLPEEIMKKSAPSIQVHELFIEPRTEQLVKIPVDIDGPYGIISAAKLSKSVETPSALVKINNGFALTTVLNTSEDPVKLTFRNPIHIEEFNEIECNNLDDDIENMDIDYDCDWDEKRRLNLKNLRLEHLNAEEYSAIWQLCDEYRDIFYCENEPLPFTNEVKHKIRLSNEEPVFVRPYRLPQAQKEEVKKQVDSLLEQGIVRNSSSPWSSPVLIVPKKIDASGLKKWRMVIDYRRLNEKTIEDKYPIPMISDILDKLGKSQYYSTIDLKSGYHQLLMSPEDIEKTAFSTDEGHYEYTRMPFGLRNAPATFQRLMNNLLRGLQHEKCFVYLDDVIIFSTSLQEHIERLREVFERLRKAGLKIQLDKSEFLHKEVAYLGHIITDRGVMPNPDKVEAVLKYPLPKTRREIKGFLGLVGYYRKFIKDFARLTKPLTLCLKKNAEIKHTEDFIKAFEICKKILTNQPILQYPDFTKPFILTTDASNVALGAVLSQGNIGSDKPICYASRTLNETEQKYSTIEKELLAIVWAVKYFRPYLFGRKFYIYTDHRPLTWIMNLKEPNSKLIRWRLKLEEFDYEIIYKKGKYNTNADALSRIQINALTRSMKGDDNQSIIANFDDSEIEERQRDRELNTPSPSTVQENLKPVAVQTNLPIEDTISDSDHSNINIEPKEGIKISEDAIESKPNQYFITSVNNNPRPLKQLKVGKQDKYFVQISRNNNEQEILNFFKNYIGSNKKHYFNFDTDRMYQDFSRVYITHFNNNAPEVISCPKHRTPLIEDDEIQEVIRAHHEGKTNHRGINETTKHISNRYYFPKMQQLVKQYIDACEICQKAKYDRNPPQIKMMLTNTPSKPMQIIHADTFVMDGHSFVTLIDAFTKVAQAFQVQSKNAVEVADTLIDFFRFYGVPEQITMDNGSEFLNGTVLRLLALHKIKSHFITPHNPESNGMVERFHSTLLEHIRIMKQEYPQERITTLVKYALVAYNSTIHSATNFTPYSLLLGHTSGREIFDQDAQLQIYEEYVQKHHDLLEKIYENVKQKIEEHKIAVYAKRNENVKPHPFKPNMNVYQKDELRNKTRPKYNGPVKINKVQGNQAIVQQQDNVRKVPLRKLKRPPVVSGTSQSAGPSSQDK